MENENPIALGMVENLDIYYDQVGAGHCISRNWREPFEFSFIIFDVWSWNIQNVSKVLLFLFFL